MGVGELNLDKNSQLCAGLCLHYGQRDKQEPGLMDITMTLLDFKCSWSHGSILSGQNDLI